MKKYIVLGIFAFLSLNLFAQIQRTFFDCTLGISTLPEVNEIIHSKNFEVYEINENKFSFLDVKFGGVDWAMASFYFFNGKLKSFALIKNELTDLREQLDIEWKILSEKLTRKYDQYIYKEDWEKRDLFFKDKKNSLNISYVPISGHYALYLSYSDNELTYDESDSDDSEL